MKMFTLIACIKIDHFVILNNKFIENDQIINELNSIQKNLMIKCHIIYFIEDV